MIHKLISLANHLDSKGLVKESDYLDYVISKLASHESDDFEDVYSEHDDDFAAFLQDLEEKSEYKGSAEDRFADMALGRDSDEIYHRDRKDRFDDMMLGTPSYERVRRDFEDKKDDIVGDSFLLGEDEESEDHEFSATDISNMSGWS